MADCEPIPMSDTLPRITIDGEALPPEAITYELTRLVKFYAQHMPEEQVRAQLPILREKAIEQAIGAKLLFNAAEKLEIVVTDEDVEKSIFNLAKECGGMNKLREQLNKQHITMPAFRENVRRGRRMDTLIAQITSAVPEPTEQDIKDHFEAHQSEYTKPERVLAQHILISAKEPTDESKAEAKAKLEEIRQRVINGADFGDEASAHSECPSGKNGGSLGWFSRGMMVPAFDQAVFSMKDGEVSDIIETQFGYHIIYRTDHEDAAPADFNEAHESIRDFLHHARRGEALSSYVNDLRAKAKVEIQE